MAGQVTVAEVEEQVEPGEFDPEPDPPARDLRAAGASTHLGAGGAQADRAPERAPSRHRHRRQGGLTRAAHRGGGGRPRALELSDGAYVNLGIGLPALVSNYVPDDVEIVLQSENGILGIGDYLVSDNRIPDLIDAGKGTVTLRQGSAFFDSATSFGMGPRRQGRRSHPRRDACRVFGEVYAAMAEHWARLRDVRGARRPRGQLPALALPALARRRANLRTQARARAAPTESLPVAARSTSPSSASYMRWRGEIGGVAGGPPRPRLSPDACLAPRRAPTHAAVCRVRRRS